MTYIHAGVMINNSADETCQVVEILYKAASDIQRLVIARHVLASE